MNAESLLYSGAFLVEKQKCEGRQLALLMGLCPLASTGEIRLQLSQDGERPFAIVISEEDASRLGSALLDLTSRLKQLRALHKLECLVPGGPAYTEDPRRDASESLFAGLDDDVE